MMSADEARSATALGRPTLAGWSGKKGGGSPRGQGTRMVSRKKSAPARCRVKVGSPVGPEISPEGYTQGSSPCRGSRSLQYR